MGIGLKDQVDQMRDNYLFYNKLTLETAEEFIRNIIAGKKIMETRTVVQIKVWKLFLRPLIVKEDGPPDVCCLGYDESTLWKFFNEQRAPKKYKDGPFMKSFKPGSPIEMYSSELGGRYGVFYEWVIDTTLEKYLKEYPQLLVIELNQ